MADACCTADFHLDTRFAAFRGAMADANPHAHLAWQWMASIGPEPLVMLGPGQRRVEADCLLIPGGAPHRVAGATPMVMLWFDPATIRRQPRFAAITAPGAISRTPEEMAALEGVASAAVGSDFRSAASRLASTLVGGSTVTPDPLAMRAMARLVPDAAAAPTISTLARELGVPVRTLRARFSDATGTSLRAYRLWARLVVGIQAIAAGANITAAAHEAGFADGAHFSRTFQRQFGLAPVTAAPLLRGGVDPTQAP
jgi:AraC-like DNA-binding protein